MNEVTRRSALRLAAAGAVAASAGAAAAQEAAARGKHDVGKLISQVGELRQALTKLADEKELAELIPLFKRPGWTTPAEFLFAAGIADAMLGHTKALMDLKQALVAGSRAVVAK